jgi:hypothetical protein
LEDTRTKPPSVSGQVAHPSAALVENHSRAAREVGVGDLVAVCRLATR